jgi:diacylglycerol kinase (ATP)
MVTTNKKTKIEVSQEPVALLVNTKSRRGHKRFDHAKQALHLAGVKLAESYAYSDSRQLSELAQRAVENGAKIIIVGSGDGTISHVVDYLIHHDVVLGVLPLGTANNLARTLEIPLELEQACRVIAAGWTTKIDLGVVNGNYFVNVASMGLGAEIIAQTPPRLKRHLGVFGYTVGAMRAGLKNRPFTARLKFGEQILEIKAIHIAVANGRSFGGGIVVASDARIDDGELIVTIFKPVNLVQLAQIAWGLNNGSYLKHACVQQLRNLNRLTIEVVEGGAKKLNIDGDLAETAPFSFSLAPHVLKVFVPEDKR